MKEVGLCKEFCQQQGRECLQIVAPAVGFLWLTGMHEFFVFVCVPQLLSDYCAYHLPDGRSVTCCHDGHKLACTGYVLRQNTRMLTVHNCVSSVCCMFVRIPCRVTPFVLVVELLHTPHSTTQDGLSSFCRR